MSPDDDDPLRAERELFGRNVRAVREHRGMGQRELAARMAERRYPWHQNTVTRVETGARDLTFGEIRALAAILGVAADRFAWATQEASDIMLTNAATERLREAWHETAGAASRLHAARAAADHSAAEHEDSKFERVRVAARGLRDELESATLESALDEAEARWRRIKRGDA